MLTFSSPTYESYLGATFSECLVSLPSELKVSNLVLVRIPLIRKHEWESDDIYLDRKSQNTVFVWGNGVGIVPYLLMVSMHHYSGRHAPQQPCSLTLPRPRRPCAALGDVVNGYRIWESVTKCGNRKDTAFEQLTLLSRYPMVLYVHWGFTIWGFQIGLGNQSENSVTSNQIR